MPGAERILDFSRDEAHLSLRYEQLVIRRPEAPEITVPLAETAVIILANRRITITHGAISALMKHGGTLLVCDEAHLPAGLMLPLSANHEQTRRIIAQAAAKKPLTKRLWQQTVQAKIRAQASVLRLHTNEDAGLPLLAQRVRSGDPDNLEAQAAQRYWPRLFSDHTFRRRFEAPDQNRFLNYGYAVLRAATARAICAAGLHPSLGIHHHARSNPYALADDLMEPYRPLVDDETASIVGEWGSDVELDGNVKARLIGLLHERLLDQGESRTIFDWIWRSASSLAQVFTGEATRIFFPEGLWHEEKN